MSPELRARVMAEVSAEPAKPIGAPSALHALAVGAAFSPMLAFDARAMGLHGRPLGFVVLEVVAWAALAVVATWGAFGRGRSMLGRPSGWLFAVAAATPIALLAVVALAYAPFPAAEALDCGAATDATCFTAVVALALGPLVALSLLRRRSDPLHPALTGAALGVASGAWGAVALAIHCPATALRHLALAHVLPVLVVGAIGALVGARLLGLRAAVR